MSVKLYTANEIAKLAGIGKNAFYERVKKRGVKPAMMKNLVTALYSEEQKDILVAKVPRQKALPRVFFRVSVMDEDTMRMFVKAAGLTKERADKIVRDYTEHGIIAEARPCR